MSKQDLESCGLAVAHIFVLHKVIECYKDAVVHPVETADSGPEKTPDKSEDQSPRSPGTFHRKSPRLQSQPGSSNSTPTRPVTTASKRINLETAPEDSPKAKRTALKKSPDLCNKLLFSHLHARKGDQAFVRVPILKTLNSRQDIIQAMRSGVLLPIPRREAVDMLVTAMYKEIESWYPCTAAKLQLAKDIITVFPNLKSFAGEPWSAFFDASSGTGHIQTCLNVKRTAHAVRIRQAKSSSPAESSSVAPPKQSKKGISSPSQPGTSKNTLAEISQEQEIEITSLSLMTDTPENRNAILTGMHKFFAFRQNMLAHSSPEDIIRKFPKLTSYNGALIDADFESLKGTVGAHFSATYEVVYKPAILKYLAQHSASILQSLDHFKDETLKSLLSLVALLPKYPWQNRTDSKKDGRVTYPPNIKIDAKKTFPHPALLQVIGTNEDVTKHSTSFYRTRNDDSKIVQPFLLYVSDDLVKGQFYLKANYHTIHVGSSCLRAFEILVKYQTVFDLEYDSDLAHFYDFIEFVFGLKTKLPAKMSTLVSSLKCVS